MLFCTSWVKLSLTSFLEVVRILGSSCVIISLLIPGYIFSKFLSICRTASVSYFLLRISSFVPALNLLYLNYSFLYHLDLSQLLRIFSHCFYAINISIFGFYFSTFSFSTSLGACSFGSLSFKNSSSPFLTLPSCKCVLHIQCPISLFFFKLFFNVINFFQHFVFVMLAPVKLYSPLAIGFSFATVGSIGIFFCIWGILLSQARCCCLGLRSRTLFAISICCLLIFFISAYSSLFKSVTNVLSAKLAISSE